MKKFYSSYTLFELRQVFFSSHSSELILEFSHLTAVLPVADKQRTIISVSDPAAACLFKDEKPADSLLCCAMRMDSVQRSALPLRAADSST